MTIEITEELGHEINDASYRITDERWDIEGLTFQIVDVVRNYEEHRWAMTKLIVLKHISTDDLYGLFYDIGSTENQDSGFVYSEPKLVPINVKEVITKEYQVK